MFLSGLLAGPDELARLAGDARPLVDDQPTLEYAVAAVSPDAELERPIVALLRGQLADVGSTLALSVSSNERAQIESVRELDLGDMVAQAVMRRAESLQERQDHAGLLTVADEALAENPASWQARRLRGVSLLSLERPNEALGDLREVARLRPTDFDGRRGLGFALHRVGRVDEAVPHYRAALALNRDHAELHTNLGAALAEQGELATARRHFQSAIRLRPDDAGARGNLLRLEQLLEDRVGAE